MTYIVTAERPNDQPIIYGIIQDVITYNDAIDKFMSHFTTTQKDSFISVKCKPYKIPKYIFTMNPAAETIIHSLESLAQEAKDEKLYEKV